MAKLGRPEKPIDWAKFEELCHIQCTHEEIASMCKVAKSTLYERAEKQYGDDFPTVYKRFSEGGKCSLRRTQFKMSNKNASMAIWLGKQYLGQKDHEDKDYIPFQPRIDQDHALLRAEYKIIELEKKLYELQPKANTEFQRSEQAP